MGQNAQIEWSGLLINVVYKSETSINVEIYSQRNNDENNFYYRYISGVIETGTGVSSDTLLAYVDDIMHQYLVNQGVNDYNISVNPNVVPTTVDYLIPEP